MALSGRTRTYNPPADCRTSCDVPKVPSLFLVFLASFPTVVTLRLTWGLFDNTEHSTCAEVCILTSKIFFVCKDFQGVYAATAVSWAVTGVSWATVERNALRIATMILRPLEVSW